MNEPRATRGPKPNSIAALTASLVLIVGLGLGAYFLEVRGAGLQAELQRGRAGEILLLIGALLAAAGTAYAAVAAGVRQSRTSSGYRRLAYRALEVDYTDPEALREFDAAPELRDLVGMLMAEKTQVHQLSDRLETLGGELTGLGEGMERSLEDLGQLRAEGLSAAGLRVTVCWNRAVERVRQAEEAPGAGATPQPPAAVDTSDGVVRRLELLEGELERLRAVLCERQTPAPVVTMAAVEPALATTGLQPPQQQRSPLPTPVSAREGTPRLELSSAAPPARFEDIHFPHFVGRPVEPITDRLEVTFETEDGGEPADLPESALLFEAEDEETSEPIVDLRALGAVEIGE